MKQQSGRRGGRPWLPSQGAFVVQFGGDTDVERGRYVGRVEHVASGQAAQFRSWRELRAFFVRVLT